jgi:hypothetical protein
MGKNNIFEVDVKGLRQLQAGKPKWFIIRELLQNAMDEDIKRCEIFLQYKQGKAHIGVTDDSPIGFRDLADAYTLFKDTYKRSNAQKRGRFNLGEKQVLCMADYARIISTTGALEFHVLKGERTTLRRRREAGSEVYVEVRMTKEEFQECVDYCRQILLPKNIILVLTVNGEEMWDGIGYRFPTKTFTAKLLTELKQDDSMRRVSRETEVHLHSLLNEKAYIYEMGIPICEIDCDYSIDVQQKVPMSSDRDTVDSKYLKTLYGEVLNHTIDEISTEQSSNIWVREGFSSDRAEKETRQEVLTKRFGEKALIANPNDKRSMDEAISNNYNVVYGSEMSGEEWAAVKQDGLMISTSAQFKTGIADGKSVKPTEAQAKVGSLSKKIAKELLGLDITVSYYESPDATVKADFSQEASRLRFNVSHFTNSEWLADEHGEVKESTLDLIIHEIGHSQGWHYEHSYHDCITKLGAKLAKRVARDPGFIRL